MAFLRALLVIICAAAATVLATTGPVVTLDRGLLIGTMANGTDKFLGIPFAQPPVGDLRSCHPHPLGPYVGKHNATAFGLSCPQQASNLLALSGLPQKTLDYFALSSKAGVTIIDGEHCLTVNIVSPVYARPGSKLPVIAWIYGGAFEIGSSALYNSTEIVNRSIALQKPVVYVTMNYRLAAFGFLASQEVKDARAGNLGLWDRERSGTRTSGTSLDTKVYSHIWWRSIESDHLFRLAFMQSGSPTPVADITHGQPYYDFPVERAGYSGSPDTLACLWAAPYDVLKAAIDITLSSFSYQSLAFVWQPRADGYFRILADDPQKLVRQGKVTRIWFVTGDCDDEGTSSSFSQLNIT